jgi:capsular polysaccharide biosynthesis protein
MNQKNEFNSFSVILFAWKWRKILLIVTLSAGVLAFFCSMFLKPMFKSTTIIYAPVSNSFLVENLDVKKYGHERETEQLIQILNSREFKDTIVSKFNLISYYKIDTLDRYWKTYLYSELDDNIKVSKTSFGSVSISVYDKDPDHAAIIANAMVDELDFFKNKIDQEHTQAACNLLQRQIDEIHEKMVIVNDSVQKLANQGLFIYDLQVDRVSQQYATALAQGNTAGAQRLQKEIDRIAKWGPVSVVLREDLIYLIRRETNIKTLLWNAEMNSSGLMPSKFVVEKATPIEKKVFPKKSLIAFFSAVSAFIVTFFVLLIVEKVKTEIQLYKKDE